VAVYLPVPLLCVFSKRIPEAPISLLLASQGLLTAGAILLAILGEAEWWSSQEAKESRKPQENQAKSGQNKDEKTSF
jgi:hypothetical protein